MKKAAVILSASLFLALSFYVVWALLNSRIHNFEGRCSMCHLNIPGKDTNRRDINFTDDISRLCANCHTIDSDMSHPVGVRPDKDIPLAVHLDKDGTMTCATCHDVHKEDKTQVKQELPGLLWGHTTGRAFCYICHNKDSLDLSWRHETALPYAHPYGKLTEVQAGLFLDKFSVECLSCHDGTVSKSPRVEVKQGMWQHGIGMSHPIGVDYPRSEDFNDIASLPKEIRIFEGRLGCLSCHQVYTREENMLAVNNRASRLCLACHKK